MPLQPLMNLLRRFRNALAEQERVELTDGDLLRRFAQGRDEAAFAELVRRHGPLVLGVCRRVLRDAHDADDAFQATFFVLARKAGAVGRPERLANWLYGVALRVAHKARAAAARRPTLQPQVTDMPAEEPGRAADARAWREVLDDELRRLPEKFRLPLLLCYLEGKSREEAARQLGWSVGAVKGMLERGRERLRERLARRGLTLSAAALADLLSEEARSAAVPAGLGELTVKAALQFAAGQSAAGPAAALAEGVLHTVSMNKLKTTVGVVLAAALAVGAGAAALAFGERPVPEVPRQVGPAPKDGDQAGPGQRQAAARLALAKTAFTGYWLRFQLDSELEGVVNLWSRRWLQAQLELSDRPADRDAALHAHQERLRNIDEVARARLELGATPRPRPERKGEPFDETAPVKETGEEDFDHAWNEYLGRKASPEQVCNASVRWLVGQQLHRFVSKLHPQADPKGLQAHLDRVKKLEANVKLRAEAGLLSQLDADTVAFYRLQAEEWLARRHAFPKGVLDPGGSFLK